MSGKIPLSAQIDEMRLTLGEPIKGVRPSVAEMRQKRREGIMATLRWLADNEAAIRSLWPTLGRAP